MCKKNAGKSKDAASNARRHRANRALPKRQGSSHLDAPRLFAVRY